MRVSVRAAGYIYFNIYLPRLPCCGFPAAGMAAGTYHYKQVPPPVKRFYTLLPEKAETAVYGSCYECLRVNAVLPFNAVSIYVVKLKCFHLALPRLYSLTDCMRMSVTDSDDVTGARQ